MTISEGEIMELYLSQLVQFDVGLQFPKADFWL